MPTQKQNSIINRMRQKFLHALVQILGVALVAGCAVQTPPGAPATAAATTPAPAAPNSHNVTEHTLKNGMRVVIKRDTRAPVAIVQVWYRVGSVDEPNGLTGVSHALEHMMFKGTPRYPGDVLTTLLKAEGARYNAFTGADYTGYYEAIRKERMELAFDIESDRMVNLEFHEADFAKEIEVVKEERRLRTDDKPHSRLYEEFYAAAFKNNPYRNPVIGWMDDLNNMRLDDLRDWYQRWYAPNNATLVVAGDVEVAEVLRLARRYFEPIPARKLPERKPHKEALRHVERTLTFQTPAKEPAVVIGFHAPVVGLGDEEWHPHALWLLNKILGSGTNSRLQTALVRDKEVARSVGSGYFAFARHNSLFTFSATPQYGVDIQTVHDALLEEIKKVQTELVDERELRTALTRARAHMVYSLDSISHQAMRIGRMETIGPGWLAWYEFFDRMEQITPQQVREVAQKYLVAGRKTTAFLKPQPLDANAADGS